MATRVQSVRPLPEKPIVTTITLSLCTHRTIGTLGHGKAILPIFYVSPRALRFRMHTRVMSTSQRDDRREPGLPAMLFSLSPAFCLAMRRRIGGMLIAVRSSTQRMIAMKKPTAIRGSGFHSALFSIHTGTVAVIVLLLLTLIYGHTVCGRAEHTGFAWVDDLLMFPRNPHLQQGWDPRGLAALVGRPYFYDWTPLFWIVLWVERGLLGNTAAGYRAVTLLAFGLCLVLLFRLLRKWTGRPGVALFAVALLAAHPMMIESLTWPTTQKTVLSLLVSIAALAAYDRLLASERRAGWWTLVFVLCIAALGIKLRGLVLPFCLLAFDVHTGLSRGDPPRAVCVGALRRTAPMVAAALAWALYTRSFVFGSSVMLSQYEPYLGGSFAASVASHAVIELRTLGHWLRPDKVMFYYDFSLYDLADWQPWLAGAAVVAVLGLLVPAAPHGRRSLAGFGVAWYAIQRGLTAGVFPNQWSAMNNRYSTVASVGLVLLLGLALARCTALTSRPDVRRARIWFATVIVLVFGAFSHLNATWLLMARGEQIVNHPNNIRVRWRAMLNSSGESIDEQWESIRTDPRAPATIGHIGLARAASHWAADRALRGIRGDGATVEAYCRSLPPPFAQLYRAEYYAAARCPEPMWREVLSALDTQPLAAWRHDVTRELEAGHERDWRTAYLRIGDGLTRYRELRAWGRVLEAAHGAAPDQAGRNAIETVARGMKPTVNPQM